MRSPGPSRPPSRARASHDLADRAAGSDTRRPRAPARMRRLRLASDLVRRRRTIAARSPRTRAARPLLCGDGGEQSMSLAGRPQPRARRRRARAPRLRRKRVRAGATAQRPGGACQRRGGPRGRRQPAMRRDAVGRVPRAPRRRPRRRAASRPGTASTRGTSPAIVRRPHDAVLARCSLGERSDEVELVVGSRSAASPARRDGGRRAPATRPRRPPARRETGGDRHRLGQAVASGDVASRPRAPPTSRARPRTPRRTAAVAAPRARRPRAPSVGLRSAPGGRGGSGSACPKTIAADDLRRGHHVRASPSRSPR